MTVLAFSKKPRAYVPQSCKGDTPPSTFEIRRLDQLEILDIMERHNLNIDIKEDEQESSVSTADAMKGMRVMLDYLYLGVSGWSNVLSEDGPLEFSEENIRCLDPAIMAELSREVQGVVTDEEVKNSEPSSESASGLATTE